MRKRLFEILERADEGDRLSRCYDVFIILCIAVSMVPLMTRQERLLFTVFDRAAAAVFILDYLLRWATADYKFGKHTVWSFLRYPFSFMAIVDLLSILPSLRVVSSSFKVLRLIRLARALRVVRVLKAARYFRSVEVLAEVFRRSKKPLLAVCVLAGAYIFVAALVMFNVEPESFDTFFKSLYWAAISLTTVGYGDIYPVTTVGRVVAAFSSLFGVAIVALPSGIVTAGYLNAVHAGKGKYDTEPWEETPEEEE